MFIDVDFFAACFCVFMAVIVFIVIVFILF